MVRKIVILIVLGILISNTWLYGQETKEPAPKSKQTEAPMDVGKLKAQIEQLIQQLGDDNWQIREAAQTELGRIGRPAQPALEKALNENKDPEIRLRASALLKQIANSQAKQNIIQAMETVQKTKGYRIKGKMSMSLEGRTDYKFETTFEDIYKNPGLSYSRMNIVMMDQVMETYCKGDILITKDPSSGKWVDGKNEHGFLSFIPTRIDEFKTRLKEARFIGKEKIGDINCKIIKADLTSEQFESFLTRAMQDKLTYSQIQYQAWIGETDNLIHKVVLSMEMDLGRPARQVDIATTMKWTVETDSFDYGEVELNIPEEVNKLFNQIETKEDKKPE